MDKIIIQSLRVDAILGIYDHERTTPQEVLIDLELHTDIRRAAQSDNIADCVDYESISNRVRDHAQNARRQTVEALAEDLAQLCLGVLGVSQVRVRVLKTRAIHFTSGVGVEITRSKPDSTLSL